MDNDSDKGPLTTQADQQPAGTREQARSISTLCKFPALPKNYTTMPMYIAAHLVCEHIHKPGLYRCM